MTGTDRTPLAGSTSLAVLANMLESALAMVRDGVARADDVDLAMRLGVRHPVGPIELARSLDGPTRDALGLSGPAPADAAVDGVSIPEVPDAFSQTPLGVVGTGFMACGIASVAAVAGQEVWIRGRSDAATEAALRSVSELLEQAERRDRLDGRSASEVREHLHGATDLARLRGCDLVVEAIAEDLDVKRTVFAELDAALPHAELLATTTSSLRTSDIAAATRRPERVGAMHFFSPVGAMKLVEIAQTTELPDALVARAAAWTRSVGKVPVRCLDRPGFIVNSLLVPFLNDAVRAHEQGVGSPAELDELFVSEAGHPMGPFQLLDMIGLDVLLATLRGIHRADPGNDRLRPAAPLVDCVARGDWGRKTGRGFYDYSASRDSAGEHGSSSRAPARR